MAIVPFDRSPLKVGQALLIGGLLIAWVVALAHPAAAVAFPVFALMLLGGALSPATSLPRWLYVRVPEAARAGASAGPRRGPGPAPLRAARRRHLPGRRPAWRRLGQLTVAWTLGWIVIALAFLNFAFDVCVGCIVYAQLVRVGLFPLTGRRTVAG